MIGAVAGTGASSTIVDLYTRRIPNVLTGGVALFGVAIAAASLSPLTISQAVLGCVVGLVLMLPGHVIGATGAGDVKLFAAFGTLLGPSAIVMAFFYTALAGGAIALVVAARRRRLQQTLAQTADLVRFAGANAAVIEGSRHNRFAYAPAIAIGALAAALIQ